MTQQTILMNAHVETYLDHEDLKMIVWEIYRDAHGIRPRWMDFSSMSVPELQDMLEGLKKDLEYNEKVEAEYEAKSLKELEASISNIMDICNCDRYRAMEYLMDAEGVDYTSTYRDQDIEHFFWCQDVGLKNAFKYRDEYLRVSPLPRLSVA
jgi:alpha-amylase/alpha-mannosidase (GH57 family)